MRVNDENIERIRQILSEYMGKNLSDQFIEADRAYYSNDYAVRVYKDLEFILHGLEGDVDDIVEEVEFANWPATENKF